jgi:hypothetical protein
VLLPIRHVLIKRHCSSRKLGHQLAFRRTASLVLNSCAANVGVWEEATSVCVAWIPATSSAQR